MNANDLLDYDLKAVKAVTRYAADLKTVIDIVPAGSIVGKVYSWVLRDGILWWMLYETYLPGKNMFVRNDETALIALNPSNTQVTVITPGIVTDLLGSNPLDSLGNFFKSGTTLIIAGIVAYVFLTRKRK